MTDKNVSKVVILIPIWVFRFVLKLLRSIIDFT